ncbi:MAG: tRNA (adenosine(37)-N6)-threonylcarbamoyltransferase complex dimerization subunit type 1 TsaB, partial [Candidatus Rokubacteria bacterium 13_1_40CM_4_69_5]
MRVLAVETSTLAGGVALLDGERIRGEYSLDVSATHSERLMPAIDRVLTDAGWTPADLQGLAAAVGPGSFTGLRIGLSAVKGLALALGIPIAAVPTLDAMAASLPFASLPVCPVLDARKGEVYCAL